MNLTMIPAWLHPAPDSAIAAERRRGNSGWLDAIHLLWSIWIFVTPLFGGGFSTRWVLLTLGSYPVFLLLYAMTLLAPRRLAWRYALGMVALCVVLLKWYPSGLSYFIYGCVMLSVAARPLRIYLGQLLLLNAGFILLAWGMGYPWQMLVWIPLVSFTVGVIVSVEEHSKSQEAALQLSHGEVRRLAATAERERIGRDLHDLLGHTLSLVALKSELAGKLVQRDPQAARLEIEEVSRVAREALAQVRRAVTGIRAAGLAAELASAKLLLGMDGITLRHEIAEVALPAELETALALAVREAVTNIQRHAHAHNAEVRLSQLGNEIQLQVSDDGRGRSIVAGNGLRGMRERVEALQGRLELDSSTQNGTCLRLYVPLPPSREQDADTTSDVVLSHPADLRVRADECLPGAERWRLG